jgi:ParB family transcriptional regulator, chromosome partitioning protein
MAGLDGTRQTKTDQRASALKNVFDLTRSLNSSIEAAVIPAAESSAEQASEFPQQMVPLSAIRLPASQPRRYFDPGKMEHLVQSIRSKGILEPVLVRPHPSQKGDYELVAGERRYRAAKEVGLIEIPAIVHILTDLQVLEVALIENLQREDLNPVEETEGVLGLLALRLNSSIEEVIALLKGMRTEQLNRGMNNVIHNSKMKTLIDVFEEMALMNWQSFVTNRLPLLNLPEDVLAALREGKLAYTKAQSIARVKDQEQRKELLEMAIANDLSLNMIKEQIALTAKSAKAQKQTLTPLKAQMDEAFKLIKKAKLWEDSKKRKRLEKLIAELKSLASE